MKTEIFFYLIAIAGVLFHLLMKYRDAYTKREKFDGKRHLIFSGFSLAIAIVLIAFRKDLVQFLLQSGIDLTELKDSKLLWFLVAYFADSVWKNVEKTGAAKLKIEETA